MPNRLAAAAIVVSAVCGLGLAIAARIRSGPLELLDVGVARALNRSINAHPMAIGFSRLILGVHYLTDVVGAWLIGGLWLATIWRVLRPSEDRNFRRARDRPGSTRRRVVEVTPQSSSS